MRAQDYSAQGRQMTVTARRATTVAFYRRIIDGAFELGEIARIEIKIQKICSPATPEPHCPCWYEATPSWPLSRPH